MNDIVELGCAGHFICADSCRFRRHTQVGIYRVSTVGNFQTYSSQRERLGPGENDWFETMVFETTGEPEENNDGCGCSKVVSYSGLERVRSATAGAAQKTHQAMIEKYKGVT